MVDIDTPPRFSRLPEPLVGALREIARVKTIARQKRASDSKKS